MQAALPQSLPSRPFLGGASWAGERCAQVNAQVSCSPAPERTWKVNKKISSRQLTRVQEQEEAFRNVPGSEEDQLTTQPLNYSLINTGASQEAGVKWFFFVRLESLHGPQECHDVKREQNRNQIK